MDGCNYNWASIATPAFVLLDYIWLYEASGSAHDDDFIG